MGTALGFIAFWFDVLLGSALAGLSVVGVLADALLVRYLSAKHPANRRRGMMPPQSVRLTGFAVLLIGSIMWTAFEKWDTEVIRADTAQQTLALRMRQQFPGFPIGYSSSALVHTFESTGWVRLNTPVVRYDWSTVPPDADVFATVYVGMYSGDRNRRSCRAARVRVRDVGTDTVAGESERIPYVPNTNQRQVVRIRLDRRTMLTSYALEVASETKDCPINAQGEIRAEYR